MDKHFILPVKTMLMVLATTVLIAITVACSEQPKPEVKMNDAKPADILGNPNYLAFSYGGYRERTRDAVPTVAQLKDDMKILSAMGIKVLRTYNTSQYAHAANLLKAIRELKNDDPSFEMYVMLGTWVEAKDSWTDKPIHNQGNVENNTQEIETAIAMVNEYPDIVKFIAVGNEAMVQWAAKYFVRPNVILKWVNYLQDLKKQGKIPTDTMITSSDNFASWGGGDKNYHTDDLVTLLNAVDFVSVHTYPFHDSHYNPKFWAGRTEEVNLTEKERIENAMVRAVDYAKSQYQSVLDYMKSVGVDKPVHIGEIGWASIDNSHYGNDGAKAADEYKAKLFYDKVREWTNTDGLTCWYFEAFDEQWKDFKNPLGSENHFGQINLNNEAKYALWDMVDAGTFDSLTRNGKPITKTYGGDFEAMMKDVMAPPLQSEMGILELNQTNDQLVTGEPITQTAYIVSHRGYTGISSDSTLPSQVIKLNPWEGTSAIEMTHDGVLEVVTGEGDWWGAALEIQGGVGENISNFENGNLHFEIKGATTSTFKIGFQTGRFAEGTQVNNFVEFGPDASRQLTSDWVSYSIPLADMNQGADLNDVTGIVFLRGDVQSDGKHIHLKSVYYTQD